MNRQHSRWRPTPPARLTWSQGTSLRSTEFNDIYYSVEGGLAEGRQIFLSGNQLPQRWRDCTTGYFLIGEIGFGTGLNFLLSWQAWREQPAPRPRLHYVAIEGFPLSPVELAKALAVWPQLADLAAELAAVYPDRLPGQHRLLLAEGEVMLDLWWADAGEALADLASAKLQNFDAWYLDGFAPSRNPAMWQPALLRAITALSREGATFATFTAAGQVRRDLQEAGFEVDKAPGFGTKREHLLGRLPRIKPRYPPAGTPWDLPATRNQPPATALVIGAGLAGCTAAAALARRGVAVTVLEQGEIAAAGSGNDQGVLYTRLSREHSPLADFALLSFCYASRYYQQLLDQGYLEPGVDGELCGSFTPCSDADELAIMAPALAGVTDFAQVISARQASERCGIDQADGGYWYPGSGWLNPRAICRTLLNGRGIELREHSGPVRLQPCPGGWRAIVPRAIAGERVVAEANCVVIAAGVDTTALTPLSWLPLQTIRGQTTDLPAGIPFEDLRAAVCHGGFIAPARLGRHCIGATFNLRDHDREIRVADHRHNLEQLARAIPHWHDALKELPLEQLSGRTGFRCASPDYLPLVGPVPARSEFLQTFAALRDNARREIAAWGDYMPGLYLSTGHGSRGLSATPLAAEILASQICAEPPPVSRSLGRALAPARFLVRDLRRKRL